MTKTALIIGAGRGFGRATALAAVDLGWKVVALVRSASDLESLRAESHDSITTISGDARDNQLATETLTNAAPNAIMIGGGVTPVMAPLEEQTWESLSRHWDSDVAIVFTWLQAILTMGSKTLERTIVISSGAAINGSPGSGGYAGAKATTRWLTTASASSSARTKGLPTTFTAVMPQLTHDTELGKIGVAGYATMSGRSPSEALAGEPPYTAASAGSALADLLTAKKTFEADTLLLGPDGLTALPS